VKGKLIIGGFDDLDFTKTEVYEDIEPYGYVVRIDASLGDDFNTLISAPYDFDELIDMLINVYSDSLEWKEFLMDFKVNRVNYLKDIEYVIFRYEPCMIADYLKNNPVLANKKIIFEDYVDLDPRLVNDISLAFGSNTSNIYFDLVGNSKLISFDEYKDTIDAIDRIITDINKYTFSPIEKIMYVYDLVRDKVYTEVDDNEDKMLSRNLSSSLLGNKIVCVGYSIVFKTLLDKLGIGCREVYLRCPNSIGGHARNEVYIKDEKYGIDGVYYFDATWDSKKEETDNKFLSSYKFFAMTKKDMDKLDNGSIIDDKMPVSPKKVLCEFVQKIEDSNWSNVPSWMISQINYMSYLVYGKSLIEKFRILDYAPVSLRPNKDEIIAKLNDLIEYFDKQLSADTFLEILYNVRKVQFYSNPDKYLFDLNEFRKIALLSGWKFMGNDIENLVMIFGSKEDKMKLKSHQFAKCSDELQLDRRVEQVKLVKTLKKIYEKY